MTLQSDIDAIDITKPINATAITKPSFKSMRDNFAAIKGGLQELCLNSFSLKITAGSDPIIAIGVPNNLDMKYFAVRCKVVAWAISGDTVGDIIVDILKGAASDFPLISTSIAGTELPTLFGAQYAFHTLTTPWQFEAGDGALANVLSCVDLKAASITFLYVRN